MLFLWLRENHITKQKENEEKILTIQFWVLVCFQKKFYYY